MKKKTALTIMHIAPSTVRYDAVAARDSNEVGQILIHEVVKHEDGTREQEVEIFYRFIGKVE